MKAQPTSTATLIRSKKALSVLAAVFWKTIGCRIIMNKFENHLINHKTQKFLLFLLNTFSTETYQKRLDALRLLPDDFCIEPQILKNLIGSYIHIRLPKNNVGIYEFHKSDHAGLTLQIQLTITLSLKTICIAFVNMALPASCNKQGSKFFIISVQILWWQNPNHRTANSQWRSTI